VTSFFDRFSAEEVEAIKALASRVEVKRGQEIFHRGDPAARFFWIETGAVHVVVTSSQGKDLVLRRLAPGDVFGEIALFTDARRTATIVATEASVLAAVDARDFRDLVRRRPGLSLALLEYLSDRTRKLTEQLEDSFFLPMRARLAKVLLGLSEEIGESTEDGILLSEPLSQTLLARLVYATREEVNRELGRWTREGWIRKQDGLLELVDSEALDDLAWS